MARKMKLIALVTTGLTFLFTLLYFILEMHFLLSFSITAGTFSYHFLMRLSVGWIIDRIMKNKANYHRPWYRTHKLEHIIYKFLNVKKWKKNLPTYSPALFDPAQKSYHEIAQAMCQAEIVHECIIILSFFPVFTSKIFGDFWIFLATSTLAAIFDLSFVMIQRFNRPRIIKLIDKTNNLTVNNESRSV